MMQMKKGDLRVGQQWKHRVSGELRTIIHVAVEHAGNSVAWRNQDGIEGGGEAETFVAQCDFRGEGP